jgi:hypothetical protein
MALSRQFNTERLDLRAPAMIAGLFDQIFHFTSPKMYASVDGVATVQGHAA